MSGKQPKLSKDDAVFILERIDNWINNCDSKASIIIGFDGVILTLILTSNFYNFISNISCKVTCCGILFLIFVIVSIFIFGMFKLVQVIIPQTCAKTFKEIDLKEDSLIYFKSISQSETFLNYKARLSLYDKKEQLNDVLSQIYINSKICTQKFDNLKLGIQLSLLGIIGFLVIFVIGKLLY